MPRKSLLLVVALFAIAVAYKTALGE